MGVPTSQGTVHMELEETRDLWSFIWGSGIHACGLLPPVDTCSPLIFGIDPRTWPKLPKDPRDCVVRRSEGSFPIGHWCRELPRSTTSGDYCEISIPSAYSLARVAYATWLLWTWKDVHTKPWEHGDQGLLEPHTHTIRWWWPHYQEGEVRLWKGMVGQAGVGWGAGKSPSIPIWTKPPKILQEHLAQGLRSHMRYVCGYKPYVYITTRIYMISVIVI